MRIVGIDAMRTLAVLTVVVVHVFDAPAGYELVDIIVNQVCRFAVSFFFVASGFFYGRGLRKGRPRNAQLKKASGRILGIYLFWSLVYFVEPDVGAVRRGNWFAPYPDRLARLTGDLEEMLLVGPGFHLWFLVALLSALLAFDAIERVAGVRWTLVVAAALYIVGVLGKAYADMPFGLSLPIDTRNFVFLSLLPFTLGTLIGTDRLRISGRTGLALWVLGTLLHFSEILLVRQLAGTPMDSHDYVFSTVLMGLGAFAVGASNPAILDRRLFELLGPLTLGIFASHIFVRQYVYYLGGPFPPLVWSFVAPLATFVGASLLSLGLSKLPFARTMVA